MRAENKSTSAVKDCGAHLALLGRASTVVCLAANTGSERNNRNGAAIIADPLGVSIKINWGQ